MPDGGQILSRITEPTEGRVRIRGRVAWLLEVGTGFHPELTGRENIYINGAILGMRRTEIKQNFDKIVSFAEVEKFLDTPVKRYSSGMYVRLAFAIAAHLDPEILVIDGLLILPSRHEGMPLAVVEAMMCGRPCLVTNVSGNPEYVTDGITGFIAAGATVDAVDEALERAWLHQEQLKKMGQAAYEAIRRQVPKDPIQVFARELILLAQKIS